MGTDPASQIVAQVAPINAPFPPLSHITAPGPRIIETRVPQPQPRPQPRFSLNQLRGDLRRIGENIVHRPPPNQNDPNDSMEVRIAVGCCCTRVTTLGMICLYGKVMTIAPRRI